MAVVLRRGAIRMPFHSRSADTKDPPRHQTQRPPPDDQEGRSMVLGRPRNVSNVRILGGLHFTATAYYHRSGDARRRRQLDRLLQPAHARWQRQAGGGHTQGEHPGLQLHPFPAADPGRMHRTAGGRRRRHTGAVAGRGGWTRRSCGTHRTMRAPGRRHQQRHHSRLRPEQHPGREHQLVSSMLSARSGTISPVSPITAVAADRANVRP